LRTRTHASPGRCWRRTTRCEPNEYIAPLRLQSTMTKRSDRRPENLQIADGTSSMPTNDRGPGVRLSSGPEQSMLANRPVIVTQSDLLTHHHRHCSAGEVLIVVLCRGPAQRNMRCGACSPSAPTQG
jgi:hypothetical protein